MSIAVLIWSSGAVILNKSPQYMQDYFELFSKAEINPQCFIFRRKIVIVAGSYDFQTRVPAHE